MRVEGKVKKIILGGKIFNVCQQFLKMPKKHFEEYLEALENWKQNYPIEKNFSFNTFAIPSVVCSILVVGDQILEINPRPELDVLLLIKKFKENLENLKWPKNTIVVDPEKRDGLWAKRIVAKEIGILRFPEQLIAPRVKISNSFLHRCIWPTNQSLKYGKDWLWKECKREKIEEQLKKAKKLGWKKIILRTEEKIEIFSLKKETIPKILQERKKSNKIYIQKFPELNEIEINSERFPYVTEAFFGFNFKKRIFEYLGGYILAGVFLLHQSYSNLILIPLVP